MAMELAFSLIILIFSVILHEVAHGYMANYLGDPTARLQGRLTLNPVSHIDPWGTIILPLLQIISTGHVYIGWAKPVPYNIYNLPGKYDEFLVAFAGPGTNIVIAVLFSVLLRVVGVDSDLAQACANIVILNLVLALFNLIPIPPLDGSKVLSGILPGGLGRAYDQFRFSLERMGMLSIVVVLAAFYLFQPFFLSLVQNIFALLTGLTI
ncbi:site-2 protease family protein [Candidatus Parcubacteria bacterium]|nr:site-2 protease family protein [Candidatus Parcubacteria bacterium]